MNIYALQKSSLEGLPALAQKSKQWLCTLRFAEYYYVADKQNSCPGVSDIS